MSRRKFIKYAGLITGGLCLNDQLFARPFSLAEDTVSKIKIGVIGCGDRGTGIMQVLQSMPDLFEVVAICDVLDFRLAAARKKYPSALLKTYVAYSELLSNKDVQAVVVATPLNVHYEIAKATLESGKHLYLEKTMTHTIDQAFNLADIALKHPGQVVQVGHQYRSSPLYYKVKDMIAAGYLGKVTQIDCRWDRNGTWRRSVPEPGLERQINWRMYKEYSGGLAAELLSHQIDFINWAFNTHPDQIYATGGIDYYKDGRETFDNIQATVRYQKEGMIGNFGATCSNARDGYLFKIKGSKGTISLLMHEGVYYPEKEAKKELEVVDGVTGATKITWNKEGGIPILPESTKDGTWYAFKNFHQSVLKGSIPDSNIFTGTKTAIVVDLINQSAYSSVIKNWKPEYNKYDQYTTRK
jgi:predicted dehydrogenase